MNILVMIILVVLLLSVLMGYKNGFLKTAFSLVSWIVVLVISNVATPVVAELLIEKTDIEIVIQSVLDNKIDEMISDALEENAGGKVQDVLSEGVKIEIPEELKGALPEELKGMLEKGTFDVNGVSKDSIDTAAIAERAVGIISLLIVLLFARVAIMVVYIVLDIASKLPLIGPFDKVLGLACGAGKGLVWTWVILSVVSVLALTGINTEWAGYIAESQLLTWFQDNNLILQLFVK